VNQNKINIRSISLNELTQVLINWGEPKFRANQIFEWLFNKSATSFAQMKNIPSSLIQKLDEYYFIDTVILAEKQVSADRTIKCAFKLYDNRVVEGVLIPTENRMTACISSQVGCSLACKFCATGKLKRMRNLEPGEIFQQVVIIDQIAKEHYGIPLSNIVYMGMGEPLLNFNNVIRSTELITGNPGLGMSPKRITVSTAGIAKMIIKLGELNVKFNLALSLHAANDSKRSEIMDINDTNNLNTLAEALNFFYKQTKNKITFEYIIFKDFNDNLQDAKELVAFCKRVPSKVNIIEYNPIEGEDFENADPIKVDAFAQHLEENEIIAKVRRSRGKDIDAACGQLANKNEVINN
jgi:23S rRNA (adenine2503-C2)-methyltransferase